MPEKKLRIPRNPIVETGSKRSQIIQQTRLDVSNHITKRMKRGENIRMITAHYFVQMLMYVLNHDHNMDLINYMWFEFKVLDVKRTTFK